MFKYLKVLLVILVIYIIVDNYIIFNNNLPCKIDNIYN